MHSGSIYLVVRDFEKSLEFYEKILNRNISATSGNRFAVFNYEGLNLCLMNGYYDSQNKEKLTTKGEYCSLYDDLEQIVNSENTRKIFINLEVEDLQAEYDRISNLGIATNLTSIRYINVYFPYWYFNFMDPDGNPIEITGKYIEE